MPQHDYWMDVQLCAEEVRVSTATIVRIIKTGKLKASKIGGQWRIRRSDWEAYIESASNSQSSQDTK